MAKIKTLIAALIWIVAIIFSLWAIFKIVPTIELAVGFITISFGILAIIWTSIARKALSEGSSLRAYVTNFLVCLIFLLLFSIWHTLDELLGWQGMIVLPKYLFITIAYLVFAIAAYQIWHIGKEFGFKEEAKGIKKIIEEKKQNSRAKNKSK